MQIKAKGFISLSIDLHHALTVESLPWHQQDPFVRIMIAQAIYEHLTIITSDRKFNADNINTIKC